MDDSAIPSISSGAVGSRFVSQSDIDLARQRRDEQWKAAYARIGQEPPPQPKEDAFDGRSLAEKLAANRAAKQEEWEERNKLGNQFRALEEDEVMFLDSIREAQYEEERKRKMQDGEELKSFREAVAARTAAPPPPVPAVSESVISKTTTASTRQKSTTTAPKKDVKKTLKGVLVKKRPRAAVPVPTEAEASASNTETKKEAKGPPAKTVKGVPDEQPTAKKRKL